MVVGVVFCAILLGQRVTKAKWEQQKEQLRSEAAEAVGPCYFGKAVQMVGLVAVAASCLTTSF